MKHKTSFWHTAKQVFTSKELRKKFFFTIVILLIFKIGTDITIPGVTAHSSITSGGSSAQTLSNVLGVLGGGGLKRFSIFGLGLSPYIMSVVIIQLLSSDIIPSWTRLNKSGELGRKRLDLYGRIIAIFIGVLQAYALAAALTKSKAISISNPGTSTDLYIVAILVGGSFISLWFGDQITKKGLGNGTSLIIFTGICASLPWNFYDIFKVLFQQSEILTWFSAFLDTLFYVFLFGFLLIATVFLNQSFRKIPIQNTGSGLAKNKKELSFLPLKINSAGVIPVIFAYSLMSTPLTIAQLIKNPTAVNVLQDIFSTQKPGGVILYFLLVVGFTFFYSRITVNAEDISENFKKSGSFIPGVSPGKPTERHITRILDRLNLIGGLSLGLIAAFPYIMSLVKHIPSQFALGGTGIIIMVGVAIDTVTQIQGRAQQLEYIEIKNTTQSADNEILNAQDLKPKTKKEKASKEGKFKKKEIFGTIKNKNRSTTKSADDNW